MIRRPSATSTPAIDPARATRRLPGHLIAWAAGILALLAATVAMPLYQLVKGGGYLYYENGFDEVTYLQYDFSRLVQGPTRPGQYLVSLAHELGLSGGYINFLADGLVLLGFPLIVRALLRRVGFSAGSASLGALLMLVLPQLVTPSNPLVQWLSQWNVSSGMIYWFTMPIAAAPPLARTPEPQFSLMLLGLALLVALKWRRFWPVYAVLPFMYPFVAIPTAFIALACHLKARWGAARFGTAGPLSLAFAAIGAACWGYHTFLVSPSIQLLVLASHLPLLSFTASVGLALWAALRHWIAPEHRFFALALALAPLVGTNQQLLSGRLPQPYNFEYYVGSLAVALVAVLATRERRTWQIALLIVGSLLFFRTSYASYRLYQSYPIRLPLTDALRLALKEDASRVVTNDLTNADLLNLVHPKQAATALAYARTYPAVSAHGIDHYRCIKRQIRADYGPAFNRQLATLDHAYAYGSQDFLFGTLNRKTTFHKLHDVSPEACKHPDTRPLKYFFWNWSAPPHRLTPTPP
jgi:hypothetical protein